MVDPLIAFARGNAFASGDNTTGGAAAKALFDGSIAPAPENDPFGLLAAQQTQAAGAALQRQFEQGLRGADGGLGRITTILGELDGFLAEGQGDLDVEARADLQRKIDNLLEDFRAIAGNPQLTDPTLVDGTGLLDLGAGTPLSVGDAGSAAAARATLERAVAASADAAETVAAASELQAAQNAVFAALTGASGYTATGGAVSPNDARALLMNGSALGLLA